MGTYGAYQAAQEKNTGGVIGSILESGISGAIAGGLIGGGLGAAAAALPQLYGSNLQRQAQEKKPVEALPALAAQDARGGVAEHDGVELHRRELRQRSGAIR